MPIGAPSNFTLNGILQSTISISTTIYIAIIYVSKKKPGHKNIDKKICIMKNRHHLIHSRNTELWIFYFDCLNHWAML